MSGNSRGDDGTQYCRSCGAQLHPNGGDCWNCGTDPSPESGRSTGNSPANQRSQGDDRRRQGNQQRNTQQRQQRNESAHQQYQRGEQQHEAQHRDQRAQADGYQQRQGQQRPQQNGHRQQGQRPQQQDGQYAQPQRGYQQQPPQHKNPGLAAVFSFLFPGAGQIYNGQVGKGVALLVFAFVTVPLWIIGIGLLITPILVIVAVYDAYTTAKKINRGQIQV